ncbi:reticulocalbin-2 [Galendromus occidentalis]|uniref:Reticulocalbin-3 n=1 Tax=Galendromus occidentalis TaxID=34638 RepID=A0AAJ6VWL3_9ACAR|nr:reticulocalbin-2 [Galendromus occidentalis]
MSSFSRTPFKVALLIFVLIVNSFCVASDDDLHKESSNHGAVSPSQEDEDHTYFEHSSILGSRKEVEEFADMSPEEAKKRLRVIANLMDTNHDGSVDRNELQKWILNSFASLTLEEASERFEDTDRDGNRLVSWDEHSSESFGDGTRQFKTTEEKLDHQSLVDEERELFDLADKDKDGFLNKEEYARLSQPHEYPEMQKVIVLQALKRKDADKDGKLSMEEFLADEKLSKENLLDERERFRHELDKNKDSYLDYDEFFHWVIPDNNQIADSEVEHLMERADDNHDGRLSIDEVVKHHDTFVNSEATDYGEHLLKYKDEL